MALFDFLRSRRNLDIIHDEADYQYQTEQIGNITIPDRLTHKNAFTLANTVTEIYNPIDFIADRASKLRYYLADRNGKELINSNYSRFLTEINPLFSLTDLIYQYIFSYLADGNAISYIQSPSLLGTASVNNITRLDILQPNLLDISELTGVSILNIKSLTDLIRRASYNDSGWHYEVLDLEKLRIDSIDQTRREGSSILAISPLFKGIRPINNLLATYSARYNVYVNNGAAGYLVKKPTPSNNLESVVDPITRDNILADINNRQGLTGRRNLWGLSSVPLEFINTLVDIQKLMPFEETLEDSIKIASIYQIPPELIPRKDQSTFSNKETAEKSVWENAIMSIVGMTCENFSKILKLDTVGISIRADYSTVSALQLNEGAKEDANTKKIANAVIMYEKGITTYNSMLEYIGHPIIEGGDKLIFDMTKTPYAVKLGVGGTQAMQMILTDANMSLEMKKNTLIVIFGLTEEEANRVTKV